MSFFAVSSCPVEIQVRPQQASDSQPTCLPVLSMTRAAAPATSGLKPLVNESTNSTASAVLEGVLYGESASRSIFRDANFGIFLWVVRPPAAATTFPSGLARTRFTSGLISVVSLSHRGSQPREKCDMGRIFPS
jgi:hypothetical protein